MSDQELTTLSDDMEALKLSDDKYKFVNTQFTKPAHKLSDHNTDIKLKLDNGEFFQSHKEVLTSASDYFSAMFNHDMVEKEQDYITLKGISAEGFRILLEYLYHGFVTLETSNITHCLEAARYFHVDWLIQACCHFLTRNLTPDNCMNILELADTHSLDELCDDMYCFIGLNAGILVEEGKVELFSHDLLNNLLCGRYFINLTEEMVLSMVIEWTNANFQEREQYLSDLLTNIKFHLLTEEEMENIPEAITKYTSVQGKISGAKNFIKQPYKFTSIAHPQLDSRGECDVFVMFSQYDTSILQLIDIERNYIHQERYNIIQFKILMDFTSLATVDNLVYSAGSNNLNINPSNVFLVFDPRLRTWISLPSMCERRENFPLVHMNGKLYAIGGNGVEGSTGNEETAENTHSHSANSQAENGLTATGQSEKEKPAADQSESDKPATEKSNDDSIIKTDGEKSADMTEAASNGDENPGDSELSETYSAEEELEFVERIILNNCECYDISTSTWSSDVPNLPFGLQAHAACCIDETIYISGGVSSNLSDPVPVGYCFKWSVGDESWVRVSSMITRRQSHAMFSYEGKIYVLGGYTAGDLEDMKLGMENCTHIETYDPQTDKWSLVCEYDEEFGHLHRNVALLDHTAYIIGGNYNSKYLHEFDIKKGELIKGPFCGNDFVRLTRLNMSYPRLPRNAQTTKVL